MASTPSGKGDLGFVRHELDTLADARIVCEWNTVDAQRYQQLCQYELRMLPLALALRGRHLQGSEPV